MALRDVVISIGTAYDDSGFRAANRGLANLKSAFAGMRNVGLAIGAAGAAMAAPLLKSLREFAAQGSRLADTAQSFGVSTKFVHELSYAAQQSGSSFEAVAVGMRTAQKAIAEPEGQKALREIGISLAAIEKLKPEKQFELIAETLARMPAGAERTAAATRILGRSGTELLPMLSGLKGLRAEATALNPWIAGTAKLAHELGDAWERLKTALGSVYTVIGKTLTPVVIKLLDVGTDWLKWLAQLLNDYPSLTYALGACAVALGIFGSGITVLGQMGWAVVGLTELWWGLKAAIGASTLTMGQFAAAFAALKFAVPALLLIGGTIAAIMARIDRAKAWQAENTRRSWRESLGEGMQGKSGLDLSADATRNLYQTWRKSGTDLDFEAWNRKVSGAGLEKLMGGGEATRTAGTYSGAAAYGISGGRSDAMARIAENSRKQTELQQEIARNTKDRTARIA